MTDDAISRTTVIFSALGSSADDDDDGRADEPELGREIEQRASNSRRPNADWGEEEGGHLFRCTRCYVIPETIFSLRAMLPLSPEADSIIVLVLLWRVYGLQSCFTANSLIPRGEVALHLGNSNVLRHDTGGSLSVRDPIEWPLLFLPRSSAMEPVRLLLSHATDGGDKERIKTCSGKG